MTPTIRYGDTPLFRVGRAHLTYKMLFSDALGLGSGYLPIRLQAARKVRLEGWTRSWCSLGWNYIAFEGRTEVGYARYDLELVHSFSQHSFPTSCCNYILTWHAIQLLLFPGVGTLENSDPWLQNTSSFDNALSRLAHLRTGNPPSSASSASSPSLFVKSSESYSTTDAPAPKYYMYAPNIVLTCRTSVLILAIDHICIAVPRASKSTSLRSTPRKKCEAYSPPSRVRLFLLRRTRN